MSAFSKRKSKIAFSDYPFRRDIENRLFLANLKHPEIVLFQELLNHSLTIPLEQLCQELQLSLCTLFERLDKLAPSQLFHLEGDFLILDKEKRRYFELQLIKFEEGFLPGMEYLQGLLGKIPPHLLPLWYQLPRRCDSLFSSIIDKYFSNPKIYQRYLEELQINHPVSAKIAASLFASPNFKVEASHLIEQHQLAPEQFHEAMLLLEFHLVCCLSYEREDDDWKEIVTPFHEWREYQLFHRHTHAPSILNTEEICRTHPRDFGFVEDLTHLLLTLKSRPLKMEKQTLPQIECHALFPHCPSSAHAQALIDKALLMHFVHIDKEQLSFLERADDWLPRDIVDKAMTMTRHPIQVEKGLRRVVESGWVYVEDFLRGFTGVFRDKEPIALKKRGKRWSYQLPSYTEEELVLIRTTLCQRLFEAGIVSTGEHEGRACFCVTAFGQSLF